MQLSDAQLLPGFDDPTLQAQQVFRGVLEAMSRPGRIVRIATLPPAPPGLPAAAAAVCLALVDFETPLWLDAAASAARHHLQFHCGCPIVADRAAALFAVIADPRQSLSLDAFAAGSDERPDRGATLIIAVEGLNNTSGPRLTGPGIYNSIQLGVTGVADDFRDQLRANHARFPCGVDLILSCADRIAALPRSVRVED